VPADAAGEGQAIAAAAEPEAVAGHQAVDAMAADAADAERFEEERGSSSPA
jgi:hypothetical protein